MNFERWLREQRLIRSSVDELSETRIAALRDAYRARKIQFFVAGKPTTQGSKRGFVTNGRAIVTEQMGAKLKNWRASVAQHAQQAMSDTPVIEGPVRMTLQFRFIRPKSHYRTGQFSRELKDSAPAHPVSGADLSKLTRAVEDAMKGIVWIDDKQVCRHGEGHGKYYAERGEPEGVDITIQAMTQENN